MLNEKLADNTRHYPVLRRTGRGLQRNGVEYDRAAHVADPVCGHDGVTGVPTQRPRPSRAATVAQTSRSTAGVVWTRYKTTSIYLMTVLAVIILVALL